MAGRIETFHISGPSGRLEALLEVNDEDPVQVALICHPHPLFQGTMHNKVVYRTARAFRRAGCAVLRFNFRGVGSSEGTHDKGIGEVEDARACLNWLRERFPALQYSLAGFSFGSRIVMQLGATVSGPQAVRVVPVGFPINRGSFGNTLDCTLPRHFVISTNDEFCPQAEMEALFPTFAGPKTLTWIEAKDHFFAGGLDALEETILAIAKL